MLISDRPLLKPIPQAWQSHIRRWELLLVSKGQTVSTVNTRIRHIRSLARGLEIDHPGLVTENDLICWSGEKTWQPETRNAYHATVRTFFRWYSDHMGTADPATSLGSVRRPTPPPRPAPDTAIKDAIINISDRTRLILLLAAEIGMRAAEIAQLHKNDLLPDKDGWGKVVIHGKGGRQRILPVPPGIMIMINEQAPNGGYIFPGKLNGHLSAAWVGKLASRALPSIWTLHTLRHRFATTGYQNGGRDLIAVQKALGHESIETTKRYTASTLDLKAIVATAIL